MNIEGQKKKKYYVPLGATNMAEVSLLDFNQVEAYKNKGVIYFLIGSRLRDKAFIFLLSNTSWNQGVSILEKADLHAQYIRDRSRLQDKYFTKVNLTKIRSDYGKGFAKFEEKYNALKTFSTIYAYLQADKLEEALALAKTETQLDLVGFYVDVLMREKKPGFFPEPAKAIYCQFAATVLSNALRSSNEKIDYQVDNPLHHEVITVLAKHNNLIAKGLEKNLNLVNEYRSDVNSILFKLREQASHQPTMISRLLGFFSTRECSVEEKELAGMAPKQ